MSNSRVSTWSGIRNKLENDYLCPALRGHIQYFATSYSKSADHEGRAAIRVDGVEVLRSNYYTYFENVWTKFHHLRSTTLKDHDSAKEAINQAHAYALEQGTFDQKVFYEAFGIFDNQSIEKSLVSENPLVRIFALLDRRLGKRRLLALEDSMEQELDWVRDVSGNHPVVVALFRQVLVIVESGLVGEKQRAFDVAFDSPLFG